MADSQRLGRHRQSSSRSFGVPASRGLWTKLRATIVIVVLAIAITVVFAVHLEERPRQDTPAALQSGNSALPTTPGSYIGLYADGVPYSYGGVEKFTSFTDIKPQITSYYSGWLEPFDLRFATTASERGAVPLVQIDPSGISLAAIASGQYDAYLIAYAKAVRAYRHPVILSFGHEMNGYWYSWGYQHTPPAVFVSAWRHIVTVFRMHGARNVTWLWTINIIHKRANVPSPRPWWPGSSYVTWVGIDGYYDNTSSTFSSLFGPTITSVRAITADPILIAETAVAPAAGQPAKIADLFAGVRLYGLLGFIWFDSVRVFDWHLSSPAAVAAFRRGAETLHRSPND